MAEEKKGQIMGFENVTIEALLDALISKTKCIEMHNSGIDEIRKEIVERAKGEQKSRYPGTREMEQVFGKG